MARTIHVPDQVPVLAAHVLLPDTHNSASFAIAYFTHRVLALAPKATWGKVWNGVIPMHHIVSELVAKLQVDEVASGKLYFGNLSNLAIFLLCHRKLLRFYYYLYIYLPPIIYC
jgi:hypothetical protein